MTLIYRELPLWHTTLVRSQCRTTVLENGRGLTLCVRCVACGYETKQVSEI